MDSGGTTDMPILKSPQVGIIGMLKHMNWRAGVLNF